MGKCKEEKALTKMGNIGYNGRGKNRMVPLWLEEHHREVSPMQQEESALYFAQGRDAARGRAYPCADKKRP